MKADITLVHGTFQPKAAWTIPEHSALCRFIEQELGPGVRFHRAEWSGSNTHAERRKAAQQLRSDLLARMAQDPHVPQFVIGHSHGGTVISYAVQEEPELQEKLAGIVLLATPFIQVRRRSLGPALLFPVFLGIAIGSWRLVALYGDAMKSFTASWHWLLRESVGVVLGLGVLAMFILTIVTAVNVFMPGKRGLPGWLEKKAAGVLPSFECDRLPADRTLIIRSNADEAASGLAMLQILSRILGDISAWFARLLYLPLRWLSPKPSASSSTAGAAPAPGPVAKPRSRPPHRPSPKPSISSSTAGTTPAPARFAKLRLRLAGCLSAAVFVTAMLLLNGRDLLRKLPGLAPAMDRLDSLGDWLNRGWGWAFDALTILVIVVLVQLVIVTPFMLLLARGFGIPASLFVFFLDVSVEATPPGRWEVHLFRREEGVAQWMHVNPLELAHSASYADPRVHALIGRWMAARVAAGTGLSAARAAAPPSRRQR